MNFKKILASVAACALAVSAMSVAAFAEDGAEPEPAEKKIVTVMGEKAPYAKVCLNEGEGDFDVTWVVATEDNDKAFEGKTTITCSGSWWDEKEVSVAELIGEVKPEDVKSITFSSTGKFTVGYNTAEGWGQKDPADTNDQVVTDMLLAPIEVPEDVEVNILIEDEFTSNGKDGYACVVFNGAAEEGKVAKVTIKDTDVLAVAVTAPEDVDISNMTLMFNGYDSSWGGWKGATSEAGVLTFKATIKDIMTALGLEKAEDVFGVNLEIQGLAEGAKVTYKVGTTVNVEITDAPTSSDDEPTSSDDEPTSSDENGDPSATNPAGPDKNEPTGVVLAVIPAAVALAGVIISKKRG